MQKQSILYVLTIKYSNKTHNIKYVKLFIGASSVAYQQDAIARQTSLTTRDTLVCVMYLCNPRISPLIIKYEYPQLFLLIITSVLETNEIESRSYSIKLMYSSNRQV